MITLSNINFSYDTRSLLNDVNLTIKECDFLGIIGVNGCGKTTLMKIILGLLKPNSGEIIYTKGGENISTLSMGYLPQYSQIDRLFPVTVYETVSLGLLERGNLWQPFMNRQQRVAVEAAVERMGITPLLHSHIGTLSGGELQRVMLARSIVSKPDVIILDEPDTYLDNDSENIMYSLLKELSNECAVVLVSHDVDNVRKHAKRIFSLDSNEIIYCSGC